MRRAPEEKAGSRDELKFHQQERAAGSRLEKTLGAPFPLRNLALRPPRTCPYTCAPPSGKYAMKKSFRGAAVHRPS